MSITPEVCYDSNIELVENRAVNEIIVWSNCGLVWLREVWKEFVMTKRG